MFNVLVLSLLVSTSQAAGPTSYLCYTPKIFVCVTRVGIEVGILTFHFVNLL